MTPDQHPAMTDEIRNRVTQQDAWARLHRDAVTDRIFQAVKPKDASTRIREEYGHEQAILRVMEGIEAYSVALDSPDYVLGEALAEMVRGFRMLLNGPLGRLDGGTLDSWACSVLERIGVNADTYDWITT